MTPSESKSARKSFTAVLEPLQTGLGWVVARVPFDIASTWPTRKGTRVRGEIEGFPFRTSLMAYQSVVKVENSENHPSGAKARRLLSAIYGTAEAVPFQIQTFTTGCYPGGGHFLLVNRKMQMGAKVRVGARVKVELEPDLEDRPAVVPPELAQALKEDKRLRRWFDGLGTALRRDVGKWILEPKSAASRQRRADQVAEWMLLTMEGEIDPGDPPPLLKAAFLRQPLARAGWEAMTAAQRRSHLLGIFHYQSAAARERRAAQAVEDAVRIARKGRRSEEERTTGF
jgi:uncharacterized protein YdeI (YjbR/CyaY-like superfamily)